MAYVVSDETMLDLASCSLPSRLQPTEVIQTNDFGVNKQVFVYNAEATEYDFRLLTRRRAQHAVGRHINDVVMSWYSDEAPSVDEIRDTYPGFSIVRRGISANNQVNADIGQEIFGMTFDSRHEMEAALVENRGRRMSLMKYSVNRFLRKNKFVSTNFVRGWLKGAFDVPNTEIDSFERECEVCACLKIKNVFDCHMKINNSFLDVNVYIGDEGEHITGLRSLIDAEVKYSGKILELGHLFTVDTRDPIMASTLDFARIYRCAHRCMRDILLNVPENQRVLHQSIFDHIIHVIDLSDKPEWLVYKLLNCRYNVDVLVMPDAMAVHSYSIFLEWLNSSVFIVGQMHTYFKEMISRSRIYFDIK